MKNSMLRTLCALLVLVSTTTGLVAQDSNYTTGDANYASGVSKTHFGIKGGVNLANLRGDDFSDERSLVGFNLGVFAKAPMSPLIAIQPEVYFTTKGSEVTYNTLFADGTAKYKFNYIEVPLLLVINVTPFFNLHFGPYVSFLIGGKAENKSDVVLFNFEDNLSIDNYNRVDAGMAAGLGLDIGTVGFGARYTIGMTTIGQESNFAGTNYIFPNAKHNVLNFYLSLAFN